MIMAVIIGIFSRALALFEKLVPAFALHPPSLRYLCAHRDLHLNFLVRRYLRLETWLVLTARFQENRHIGTIHVAPGLNYA